MLITSPGFRLIKTEALAYICRERHACGLSRLISSLRVRLVSSESSQSCPRRAHRVDGRVPLMHLLTWDCKAVRCEVPLLRSESNRISELMRRCPARTGRQRRKAPNFDSHLYNIPAFSPISLSLSHPNPSPCRGGDPTGQGAGWPLARAPNHGRDGTAPSVTGLMPPPPPPPEADPAYRTRPGSGWTNMPVDSNT